MNIYYVHDWIVYLGGAYNVLCEMLNVFQGPLHTIVYDEKNFQPTDLKNIEIRTSFIQKLPFGVKKFRFYFPLFPLAIEQFDLSKADVVISSSHFVAKGALTHSDQYHICYCHTPLLPAWDFYHEFLTSRVNEKGFFAKLYLHYMRMWDLASVSRVDLFITNSNYVAARIQKLYQRKAVVVNPPIDTEFFSLKEKKQDVYLTASRLAYNKKIDIIIEAFNQMPEKRLIIIGEGPQRAKLESIAKGNIEFLGFVSNKILKENMQNCKGFVFASLEDFGIAPLQAQSCGTPVIAFGKGGSLETVSEGKSGLFFEQQTAEALIQAVETLEKMTFDPKVIREHAERFSKERFREEFKKTVLENYSAFRR